MGKGLLVATIVLGTLAVLVSPAVAAPQRILSMNGCTDLLLLQLVPKDRVVSVTYRARDAARGFAPGLADGVATNDGRPEEVLAFSPDLVVAGRYTTVRTKALVRRSGIRVVELDDANSFDDIRRNLMTLGLAVGEPGRAAALIAGMDAQLARLSPLASTMTVLAWSGGGVVPSQGSLTDAVITAAGARNLRADAVRYGGFDLEALAAARPDALIQEDPRLAHPTLRDQQGRHSLVRRLYRGRTVGMPDTLLSCGLPQTADAAVALNRALATLPRVR